MIPGGPSLTLQAVPGSLRPFQEFVRSGVTGFSEDDLHWLDLVLEELLVNVFRYGYPGGAPGPIVLAYFLEESGCVFVEIVDEGVEFDPTKKTPPALDGPLSERPVGGLGVFLVKSITESISYERRDGRNVLQFRFRAGRLTSER
jgi:serine/threonine-protein kinase RsbW